MGCKIGTQCFIDSNGIDIDNKIIPVILSNESKVMRYSWDEGEYDLILEHSEEAIDLTRKDILPILLQHDTNMLPIGIYQNVRLEDGKLKADAKFDSEDEKAMEIFGKMSRGFMQTLSIGLTIHSKVLQDEKDNKKTYKATRWEIYEASVVTVPAIPTATVGMSTMGDSNVAIPNTKLANSNTGANMTDLEIGALQNKVLVLEANKDTVDARNEKLELQLKASDEKLQDLKASFDKKLSIATTTANAGADEKVVAFQATMTSRVNQAFTTGVATADTVNALLGAKDDNEANSLAVEAKETTEALKQSEGNTADSWANVTFKR